MSSEEDKPPAPPVRLTSNRGGDRVGGGGSITGTGDVDMRPLPKGIYHLNIKHLYLQFLKFCVFVLQNPMIQTARKRL